MLHVITIPSINSVSHSGFDWQSARIEKNWNFEMVNWKNWNFESEIENLWRLRRRVNCNFFENKWTRITLWHLSTWSQLIMNKWNLLKQFSEKSELHFLWCASDLQFSFLLNILKRHIKEEKERKYRMDYIVIRIWLYKILQRPWFIEKWWVTSK